MKIYIAGPMTGIADYNYPAFAAASEQLTQFGYHPLNPATHDISGEIQPWQHYMRLGLRMLLDADAVATLPGWERSRGASLEVHIAETLTMPIKALSEWLPPLNEWLLP